MAPGAPARIVGWLSVFCALLGAVEILIHVVPLNANPFRGEDEPFASLVTVSSNRNGARDPGRFEDVFGQLWDNSTVGVLSLEIVADVVVSSYA